MKKIILGLAFVSALLFSCKKKQIEPVKTTDPVQEVPVTTGKSLLNIGASTVEWEGSKPTESHNGVITVEEGFLSVENNKLLAGQLVVNMNSIKNLDQDKAGARKILEDHLKGKDFFDVATYPLSKFVITSVITGEGEKVQLTGNITIKDKKKSITIPATFKSLDNKYRLETEVFGINRLDFGITYKSKTIDAALKDKFINDVLELKVVFEAKK